MENAQEDFLDDLLADDAAFNMVRANVGKRFLNYLIDLASFYLLVFVLGFVAASFFPSFLYDLENINPIVSMVLFGLYMGSIEALSKGRSLGKLVTGTKAVYEDGGIISAQTAFARGACRIVPFNQLSAFGDPPNPWHDKWNSTYVIDLKKSMMEN
jgi:uncharacterized RDD family membrane protein YckC